MRKLQLFIVFLLCSVSLAAQNEGKANDLFQAADYPAALQEYELLLRRYPSSALFAYRYARCAQELGDYQTAIQYFNKSGNRYDLKHFNLGEIYLHLGYPEQAIASYEAYLQTIKPESERAPYVHEQIHKAEKLQRYMRRVEQVEIIDSVETTIDSILAYCPLSAEVGTVTRDDAGRFVYTNQRNDRKLWATIQDSTAVIVSSHYLMDHWTTPDTLPQEVNMSAKQAYPYVLSDGVTLYFAACDTSGLGGYDIYVTRYNTYTESYTISENVGMPFNSTGNDYLMMIDENKNIGYFATDRFSPKGSVRVYSFVPKMQKTYWRDISVDSLVAYAQLRYAMPVQEPRNIVKSEIISPSNDTNYTDKAIFFVLNDSVVYTSLKTFKNTQAKKKYKEWENLQKQLNNTQKELYNLRHKYSLADEAERKKIAPTILQMEEMQNTYTELCDKLIHECRELEMTAYQQ